MKWIAILLLAIVLFGCSESKEQVEKVSVEFRLAETEPADSLTKMVVARSGDVIYMHPHAVMTNEDIASARVTQWQDRPTIQVDFTKTGSKIFADLTRNNIEKRIAILVDGKLVTAPIVKAPILGGVAIINGTFTKEEAERIARGIVVRTEN